METSKVCILVYKYTVLELIQYTKCKIIISTCKTDLLDSFEKRIKSRFNNSVVKAWKYMFVQKLLKSTASNVNYQAVNPFLYRELEGISLDELAEIVDCRSDGRIQYDGMLSGRYGYPTDLIAHVFC